MAGTSVAVKNLRKTYGDLVAVRDLSFSVSEGSLFAFLGANGAGKSTTISCITTVLSPDSGTAVVAGHDVARDPYAVRREIGAVFQSSLLDPLLTVRENLTLRAGLYGIRGKDATARIDRLAELVGVDAFLTRRYGRLSGGQRRRADIARALLHDPSVVFLDEPTAGLDPASREQIWTALARLRAERGATVFLTTHYMEETERADRVCIIERGEIVAEGTPAHLRATHSASVLTVRTRRPEAVAAACRDRGLHPQTTGDGIRIPVPSSHLARELLALLEVDDFEFRHGTMDDVFLAVTGGGDHGDGHRGDHGGGHGGGHADEYGRRNDA